MHKAFTENQLKISSEYKTAVIGAGAISRRGHLPALKKLNNVQIGIFDVNSSLLQSVGDEFGISQLYKSFDQVLDDDCSIVHICTPTGTHKDLIIQALYAGKQVLVEKPLAQNLSEAIDIYRVMSETGGEVGIVQNWRYYPAVRKAKNRLSGGYLGRLVSVHGNALTRFPNSWTRGTWLYHEAAVLMDFAPHLVDQLLWFNEGSVKTVFAVGGDFTNGNMNFMNYIQIMIEFDNGVVVTADISWLTGSMIFSIELHGTSGHIYLDVKNDVMHELHGTITPIDDLRHYIKRLRSLARGLTNGSFFGGPMVFYKTLILDFLQSVEENKKPPVPLQHGFMINLVLDAAKESFEKKKPVNINEFLLQKGCSQSEVDLFVEKG